MKPIKRFIAGAQCPHCKEIDKTVVYRVEDKQVSECVRCGFSLEMRDEDVSRNDVLQK